jgi:hypothetical protein
MFGALVFAMTAWLAFDSYTIRRDFLTGSRGLGFSLLVISQILGAFSFGSETYAYAGYILRLLGLILVLWNLILEKPVERPSLNAVFVLPSIVTAAVYFNFWDIVLFSVIAFLSYRQYRNEDKKTLLPSIYAFSLLAMSALASVFYTAGHFDAIWIIGHIIEIAGFVALAIWVWQYLKLRVREMLLLIFFSASLLVSIVVTLAFSMILIRQIELAIMNNLSANIKLADYLILHLKEESLSKARIFSSTVELRNALTKNDFSKLEKLANNFIVQENLSLLTVADRDGNVVLRANQTSAKVDNILVGKAGQMASEGYSIATIDSFAGEKFAIKAISPVISSAGTIVGYTITGFILDNPFVDSLKKITGLDVSVYDKNKVVASTITGLDDRTRISGTLLSNILVEDTVLKNGKSITLNNDIVTKPYISSYLALEDFENGAVGMISLAKSQREMFEIANTTNILTLISVMIIMAMLAAPIFKFSKRLLE